MEGDPLLAPDEDQKRFASLISCFDAPASIRRGRAVEAAVEMVHAQCQRQRDEWLRIPRLHLGQLQALAGTWDRVAPFLVVPQDTERLREVHDELAPKLRFGLAATNSDRILRRHLHMTLETLDRFNRRFEAFVSKLDLSGVNQQITDYNRHYVFEKECIVRSQRIARHGFVALAPMTAQRILEKFPLLPTPRMRDEGPRCR